MGFKTPLVCVCEEKGSVKGRKTSEQVRKKVEEMGGDSALQNR